MIRSRGAWALAPAALAGAALTLVHAALLRTDPVADAMLDEAPAQVRLWFSEEVRAAPDPVVVLDPQGRRVDSDAGVSPDDRTELRASVSDGGPGTYTVRWRALSEDGHVIEDGYTYSVQVATTPAAAAVESGSAGGAIRGLLVTGRGLQLIGLTLALGALALGLLIGPSLGIAQPIVRVGVVGSLAMLVAAPVMLLGQAAAMAGSLGGAFSGTALGAVFGTPWGGLWVARLIGAVGLLVLAGRFATGRAPGRGLVGAAGACALLILVATSANGHALATEPVWLSVLLDVAHLAATAAWLGGGVCLAGLAWAARRPGGDERQMSETLAFATPRFSGLALGCVQVLIVTGLYQTWAHVSDPALLTSTGYGRTLLVKLGLFVLIMAPAAINRFVIKPGLARAGTLAAGERTALTGRFGRLLALEGALGALVLAAAAVLSTLPPAEAMAETVPAAETEMDHAAMMAMMAPPMPARLWSARAGDRTVLLSLDPGLLGSNQARVTIHDAADGRTITPTSVAVRTVPPAATGSRPSLVRLASEGDAFTATLGFPAEGEWRLELVIDDEAAATFGVKITP